MDSGETTLRCGPAFPWSLRLSGGKCNQLSGRDGFPRLTFCVEGTWAGSRTEQDCSMRGPCRPGATWTDGQARGLLFGRA